MPDGFNTSNAKEIAALMARHKLPNVSSAEATMRSASDAFETSAWT